MNARRIPSARRVGCPRGRAPANPDRARSAVHALIGYPRLPRDSAGWLLSVLAVLYAAAAVLAAGEPIPATWGIHLAGFLPGAQRVLVLGGLVIGAALVTFPARVRTQQGGHSEGRPLRRPRPPARVPLWMPAVVAYVLFLWLFRSRTQLLGDGMVWLEGLRQQNLPVGSEPLSRALWIVFAALLRWLGIAPTPEGLGAFPMLCGAGAAAVGWGIAGELSRSAGVRLALAGMILTLGSAQLFAGYIESYAPAALLILTYLWLALRCGRSEKEAVWAAACLGLAVASHFGALYLLPTVFLLGHGRGAWKRGLARAALTLAVAVSVAVLSGAGPAQWVGAWRSAAPHLSGGADFALRTRPYAALSLAHAVDLLNAVALVLPVPAILLVSRLPEWRARWGRPTPLGLAAVLGAIACGAVSLPLPAAQDWDVLSLFLLPAGVLGAAVPAARLAGPEAALKRAGLVLLSASALAAFLLVNADEPAAARRSKVILAPGGASTRFARAYGFGSLSEFYRDRGEVDSAAVYALRSLREEPSNPRRWGQAGTMLLGAGRYREAVPYLAEAVRRAPESAASHNNLGIAYTGVRRYRDALVEFRAAARCEPGEPTYRHSVALALLNAGEPDSAKAELLRIKERWPRFRPAELSYARYFTAARR